MTFSCSALEVQLFEVSASSETRRETRWLAAVDLGPSLSSAPEGAAGIVKVAELAEEVEQARSALDSRVVRTPTVRLPWLDTPDRQVWAKVECWQTTGAFKYRGATNALLGLSEDSAVVTSSAGNHGLAVATAAAELGHIATVFVPVGASPLKIRRIADTGADIRIIGRDVREAGLHAITHAKRHGFAYVSPYADREVAAGNGTVIAEAAEDAGPFDSVLVPLGGGGLVAGVAAWSKQFMPDSKIVAVHPKVFHREFDKQPISSALFGPTVPTFADGLAAQLHEPTPLRHVLDEAIDSVLEVDESNFALGVYALLHKQGLLVEGAGAGGVAALLTDQAQEISGNVLLVLTGGNIASVQLARAMTSNVSDSELRQKLGLRKSLPALDSERTLHRLPDSMPINSSDENEHHPRFTPEGFWVNRMVEHAEKQQQQDVHDSDYRRLVEQSGLGRDIAIEQVHEGISGITRSLIEDTLGNADLEVWQLEERVRYVTQLQAFLRSALDRASAAYDQSKRAWFYDTASQGGAGVNYARYGIHELRSREHALKEMLGFSRAAVEVLLTSSGMAAYQTIEAFLLRNVLKAGDTIACSPYIYFEAEEQLSTLEMFSHVRASSYKPVDLVEIVELTEARVLFVDPVANLAGLPTVGLQELAAAIGDSDWSDRWLVIDGTMLSGGLQPYEIFTEDNHPRVLYYESASKYLQFGLDLQMAGVCIFPQDLEPVFRRIRRNIGAAMYPYNVAVMPVASRNEFLGWMNTLTDNATHFAQRLSASIHEKAEVRFPDEWRDNHWSHGGAVVTVEFADAGLNNRDGLEYVIELCLRNARADDIALIKGVSFGFSTSRLSACSAMAENSDPFLRFSIGSDAGEVEALADCVADAVQSYIETFANDLGESSATS